jgi:hypothetical protein
VLKSSFSARIRDVFSAAAEAGKAHFAQQVDRAEALLAPLQTEPRKLAVDEVELVRDLVAGSVPSPTPTAGSSDAVGFLKLDTHGVGIPFGLSASITRDDPRVYAAVLGHHYLEGFGRSEDEAVEMLRAVVLGFLELTGRDDSHSVGASARMRKLMHALRYRADQAESDTNV